MPSIQYFKKYQYYRAQSIISRKVIKILSQMQSQYNKNIFDNNTYETVMDLYKDYQKSNSKTNASNLSTKRIRSVRKVSDYSTVGSLN